MKLKEIPEFVKKQFKALKQGVLPEAKRQAPEPRKSPTDIARKKAPENTLFTINSGEAPKEKDFSTISTGIKEFDMLIKDKGLEKGSTLLVSGGAGTGKTTFTIQSLYSSAVENGEKGIYLSFEEEPDSIMLHMKKNYGWDLHALEKKGLFAIIKIDPLDVARIVESAFFEKEGELKIDMSKIEFPFLPDKVAVDSLSALAIAFTEEENYRKYVMQLFESLKHLNCTSYMISETEQNPRIYSRTGVEEFLADGVVVLYNLKKNSKRENAIEILKLRSSSHAKGMFPYKFTGKGIAINSNYGK